MKLLYIANARFPTWKAHGIQIAKMCEAFRESGIELELVVPGKGLQESPKEFYGLREEISIKRVWTPNIFVSTYLGFILSSFVFGITSYLYARKKSKDRAIYSIDLDYFSFFLIHRLRRPYFFEIHSSKNPSYFHRKLFGSISGVIAINNNVRNSLGETFPALRGKVLVFPNGVDLRDSYNGNKSEARKKLQLPETVKIVLYSGSFQDWKGLDTVLLAAKKLTKLKFYLVGGRKDDLRKAGYNDVIPNNVVLVGRRKFVEMPLWRAAADVLLLTGTKRNEYSYYYTSPMKLFEYMASKRPIVATRTPAIEQVVSDNEVFFCAPDDPDELARTIASVLKNTDIAKERADRAYGAVQRYSWGKRAQQVTEFISSKL